MVRSPTLRVILLVGTIAILSPGLVIPASATSGAAPSHRMDVPRTPVSPGLVEPNLSVLGNVALANGTYRAGTVGGPNGYAPTSIVYDSLDHRFFVGVGGPSPGVLVLSSFTDQVIARWAIPGGPSAGPEAVAFDPMSDRLFAADGSSGNVSVFIAASGVLRNTTYLGVGTDPVALVYDPVADVMAVAEAAADAVALLNGSSGTLLGAVTVGSGPDALCFDPSTGGLVVANGGGASVELLDPGSRNVGPAKGVGRSPDALAFDYDAGVVLVANRGSGNVSLLDPLNLSTNATATTGPAPSAVAVSTDGVAFIANARGANVTILNDPSQLVLGSLDVGPDPVAIVWDPSDGSMYVVSAGNDSLADLSATQLTYGGTLPLGSEPVASAPLGSGELSAVADAALRSVDVINESDGSVRARVALPGVPTGLAVLPAWGEVAVSVPSGGSGAGNLSIVDPAAGRVVSDLPGGIGPAGMVWSPALGALLVADEGSGTVQAVDPATGAVNATYLLPGAGHGATAVDVGVVGGTLFVSGGAANATVTAFGLVNGTWLTTIATPPDPTELAADAAAGTLWVADSGAGQLTAIDAVARRATANLTVGGTPEGLALDPASGGLFVADGATGALGFVDPANVSLLGRLPVGDALLGVHVDPTDGRVVADDAGRGDVAFIGPPPPTYPVRFTESGLVGGAPAWNLSVDGALVGGTGPVVTVPEPNGTHRFLIPPAEGLFPVPDSGSFVVAGGAVDVAIAFGPLTFNVSVIESGLPSGATWWLAVGGMNRSTSGDTITVALANGSYPYRVGTPALYAPAGSSGAGSIEVDGSSPSPTIVLFSPLPPYVVEFRESGLPPGSTWVVELGTQTARANDSTIRFRVGAGSFPFEVLPVGGASPDPPSGDVVVTTASPSPINVTFGPPAPPEFPVAFVAVGLPAGDSFTVVFAGTTRTGSEAVVIDAPNGTFAFEVHAPPGLDARPASGNLTVAGAARNVSIDFAPLGRGTSSPGPGLSVLELGGVGAAAAAAVAALLLRRRRPGRMRRLSGELVRRGAPSVGPEPSAAGGPGSPGSP